MMPKARWFIGTLLGLLLLTPTLHAQTNAALAETLFQEGKRLMGEKNYAEACPKFQESQRLDPGTGTLLNWGLCLKESGKPASAWVVFNQAVASARAESRADRVSLAQSEVDKLNAAMPRIAIQVPTDADAPGLAVTLDGETISMATRGVATPVDPGDHVVKASAPQRKSWTSTLNVPATPQTHTVVVPKLELGNDSAPPAKGGIEIAPAKQAEAGSASEAGKGKPKRFVLGLRLNLSIPGGNLEGADADAGTPATKLSDYSKVQGTFWLEAGYRVMPQLMLGVYLSGGAGGVGSLFKEPCSMSGVSCSITDVRLGVQAIYDFALDKMIPWAGAGLGYEVLTANLEGPSGKASFDASGAEWLLLQGGLDFALKQLRFGPFLSVSFARFTGGECSGSGCGGVGSFDVEKPALHEWIMLGARGTVAL
jgi:opacity protein-like surface antigen